jgi:dTDP-4-dehydrorhamnose reductase
MNIVVIGKSGQLAIDLRDACMCRRAFNVTFLGRNDINFLSFFDTESVLRTCAPEGITNAAAFTAVDQAESHYEEAAFVNETIPERLVLICQRMNIPLIHVSTDQVFDGTKKGMYNGEDAPNPLNVYGLTKWNGEQRVKDCSENSLIVRTTWIYGPFGRNFIHLCLNAAKLRVTSQLFVTSSENRSLVQLWRKSLCGFWS